MIFIHGGEDDDELHGQGVMTNSMEIILVAYPEETTGGNDILYGGDGDDQLYGRVGDDELYGGNGNDKLDAVRKGADMLSGGAGIDVAQFTTRVQTPAW